MFCCRYLTMDMMSCKFHLGVMHVTVGRAKKQYSGNFKVVGRQLRM